MKLDKDLNVQNKELKSNYETFPKKSNKNQPKYDLDKPLQEMVQINKQYKTNMEKALKVWQAHN